MTLSESSIVSILLFVSDKFSKDVFSYSKTSNKPQDFARFRFATRDLVSKQGPLDVLIRYMGL